MSRNSAWQGPKAQGLSQYLLQFIIIIITTSTAKEKLDLTVKEQYY
jgi:hypothetical protein